MTPKLRRFKAAAVQMSAAVGDVDGNVAKAERMLADAAAQGAHLVCLPEMFNTGYFSHTTHVDPAYWDLGEPLDDSPTLRRIGAAARAAGVWTLAPIVERAAPGIYHNTSVLLDDTGAIAGHYRKVHVPWSLTAWEKYYFRPGYHFPVFTTPFGRLGVQTCYDRDFPEGFRALALDGADLVLVPAGAPRALADIWRQICRVRAYENGVWLLGIGLTGKADEEHHEMIAHSLAVAPDGEVTAALGTEEAVLVVDIDLDRIETARRKRYPMRDRRPEVYGRLVEPG
jgi:beta-ureidopropionase